LLYLHGKKLIKYSITSFRSTHNKVNEEELVKLNLLKKKVNKNNTKLNYVKDLISNHNDINDNNNITTKIEDCQQQQKQQQQQHQQQIREINLKQDKFETELAKQQKLMEKQNKLILNLNNTNEKNNKLFVTQLKKENKKLLDSHMKDIKDLLKKEQKDEEKEEVEDTDELDQAVKKCSHPKWETNKSACCKRKREVIAILNSKSSKRRKNDEKEMKKEKEEHVEPTAHTNRSSPNYKHYHNNSHNNYNFQDPHFDFHQGHSPRDRYSDSGPDSHHHHPPPQSSNYHSGYGGQDHSPFDHYSDGRCNYPHPQTFPYQNSPDFNRSHNTYNDANKSYSRGPQQRRNHPHSYQSEYRGYYPY